LGGHHLSAAGLGNLLGDGWQYLLPGAAPYLILAAEYFSLIAYAAVWIGILLTARRARRMIKGSSASIITEPQSPSPSTLGEGGGEGLSANSSEAPHPNPLPEYWERGSRGSRDERAVASVTDHLSLIALGVLICQCLLDGNQRVYDGPHYFNATWIAYAVLAYLAFDRLRPKLAKLLLAAQGTALIVVLSGMLLIVARNGGTRTLGWGTTMSQQVSAIWQIGNTPLAGGGAAAQPFAQWATCPWEYDVLKAMLNPQSAPLPDTLAIVRYRDDSPPDAHIVVEFAKP
jgi:hypothetical protein